MQPRKVFDLPIGQAGCQNISLSSDGIDLTVHYDFVLEGRIRSGTIHFDDVTAFQFVDERHGTHVPGAYDAIVEVLPSDWISKLASKEPKVRLESVKNKRHFAVLLSSNGYLEVVAAGVRLSGET